MNLNLFQSVDELGFNPKNYEHHTLGAQVLKQDIEQAKFIFIGIEENDYPNDANAIRQEVYKLFTPSKHLKIADVGNYTLLSKELFSFEQLAEFVATCIEKDVIPIFFGGSRKTMFSLQKGFSLANVYQNVGFISENFVIKKASSDIITDQNFIWHILQNKESFLFQFSQLGYQSYLQEPETLTIWDDLNFEAVRLGVIRNDIRELEPSIRNLNLLGVSINSLKYSENGGQRKSSPNGLYNEELAKLLRYAGMSSQLKCLGLFDLEEATHAQPLVGARVLAQSLWCFFEGYLLRKFEHPTDKNTSFTKYMVSNDDLRIEIQFLKSEISGRWWLKIPKQYAKLEKDFYIPCSMNDYEIAINGDVPERWLNGFNKLG